MADDQLKREVPVLCAPVTSESWRSFKRAHGIYKSRGGSRSMATLISDEALPILRMLVPSDTDFATVADAALSAELEKLYGPQDKKEARALLERVKLPSGKASGGVRAAVDTYITAFAAELDGIPTHLQPSDRVVLTMFLEGIRQPGLRSDVAAEEPATLVEAMMALRVESKVWEKVEAWLPDPF